MEMIIDVSIIIVNYNTKELTRNCLKSVFERTDGISFEVIVSDNGSTDGSLEMIRAEFPQVVLIENGANLGFGAANNRALAVARGKYVFYLNSDTVLLNNAVKMFFDYWENSSEKESIGALGANLLDEDMNITHSWGRFPTFRAMARDILHRNWTIVAKGLLLFMHIPLEGFRRPYEHRRTIGEVDYITGADLFMRNDENAMFDETFFLYTEETDLEYRLALKNLSRILIGGPEIIHLQGKSDCLNNYSELVKEYSSFGKICMCLSNLIYARKHFGCLQLAVLKLLTLMYFLNPFCVRNTGKFIPRIFEV